jgi:hypothetical protein
MDLSYETMIALYILKYGIVELTKLVPDLEREFNKSYKVELT